MVRIKDILKGISLVIIFWVFGLFFSFVIFSPADTDTSKILFSWFGSYTLLYFVLSNEKWINREVNISMGVTVLILIGLYLIPINSNIPQDVIILNKELSDKNENRLDYAEELFFVIEKKGWKQPTREYLRKPFVLFAKSFNKLWRMPQDSYVPSHLQAQIYRLLLLESDRFNVEDVLFKQSVCSNSPHGYVEIIEDRVIWADFWASEHFSEEYFFGMRTTPPCRELIGTPL